jgi:hypothetical protein
MTPELATKVKCPMLPNKRVKVVVANGGELYSEFSTDHFKYEYGIQGNDLSFNFRLLPLKAMA